MKAIFKIGIILIGIIPCNGFAQRSWGTWVQLWSYEGHSCSISFNIVPNCKNFSYSFYRTDNNIVYDKGFVTFSFKYFDCDGHQSTENGTVRLSKSGIDDDQGQWFLTNGGRIIDIKVDEVFIPEREVWLKRINGQTVDYWKQRYGNQPKKEISEKESQRKSEQEKEQKPERQLIAEAPKLHIKNDTDTRLERQEEAARREQQRKTDSINAANIARQQRVKNVKKKDDEETATAAAITAGVGAVAFNENLDNKKINGRTTYFKAGITVAAYNIPAIENTTNGQKLNYSSLSDHFNYGGQAQLDAWLFNNDKFGFLLQPVLYYGINTGSGVNGDQLIYGGNARVQFGKTVKLFAEAGYFQRTGQQTTDYDAISSSYGISSGTDAVGTINYDHTIYRYGGGVIIGAFDNNLKSREIGLKLGVYVENPDYKDYNNKIKTPLLYQLQWTFDGGYFIGGEYSADYPFANKAMYHIDETKTGNYFSVQLGKVFNLSSSKSSR